MRVPEYIVARRQPEIVKPMLYVSASFAAGALAMYFLDSIGGGRRRALVRGKITRAVHGAQEFDANTGKHTPPSGDAQLRERVRARLGHMVSHPRAIELEVNEGIVRLSGQVLAKELDGLLMQLTGMAGVRKVHNALSVVTDPSGFGQPTGTISGAGEQMAH